MFFFALPLGVDYRTRRVPVVTFCFMGISVLLFLVTFACRLNRGPWTFEWVQAHLWLIPVKSVWYTYLTSLFVHDGFSHLAGNMIYLFLFGPCVEDKIGRLKFALFYLLGGVIANFTCIATAPGHFASAAPLGSASGAITACMSGFLLLLPRAKIEFRWISVMFHDFRISTGSYLLPAWVLIAIWFAGDLVILVLTMLGKIQDSPAFAGHVAGVVWGLVAISLVKLVAKPEEPAGDARQGPTRVSLPGAPGEAASIHLLFNNAQSGPFTAAQVAEMLALGSVPSDAFYWQEGTTEWRNVTELQNPTG